jgi:hypothetical protein
LAAAHDAYSDNGGLVADPSWVHTPVGTPRGAYAAIMQFGATIETISVATYGGVAFTPLTVVDGTALTEPHVVYPFFLGSSIPTGAQTVAFTCSGATSNKRAVCYTVTADTDTVIDDQDTIVNGSLDEPSVGLTASAVAVGYSALCSGLGSAANVTAGTGFTKDLGGGLSASSANTEHGTSVFSAGAVTFAFVTSGADEVVLHAILITEAGGAPAPTVKQLAALGVG